MRSAFLLITLSTHFATTIEASQLDIIQMGDVLLLSSPDGRRFVAETAPCLGCGLEIEHSVFDRITSQQFKAPPLTYFNSLTFDGETAVGSSFTDGISVLATWQVGNAAIRKLPIIVENGLSYSSADGSLIAGAITDGSSPFYWTEDTGAQRIGTHRPGTVGAVSSDGEFVAGIMWRRDRLQTSLFRYDIGGEIEWLSSVSGRNTAIVTDISGNGSTIFGHQAAGDVLEGFQWTRETGMVGLGNFLPLHSNDDGSVLVGERSLMIDGEMLMPADLIDRETGHVLSDSTEIRGVSDDGRTFSGYTRDGTRYKSWILRIGEFEACDLNADEVCDAVDIDAMPRMPRRMLRTAFDLNHDGVHDLADRRIWIEELMSSHFGDANLDGRFDSSDLTFVFQAGRYEQSDSSTTGWSDGDWNGDGIFDSGDFVAAFVGGGYESGPREGGLQTVPEPATFALIMFGLCGVPHIARRNWKLESETANVVNTSSTNRPGLFCSVDRA